MRVILSFVLFLTVFSGQVLAVESSGGRWVLDKEKSVLPQGETHTLVGGMGCPGWLCEGRYNGTTFTITVGETLITVASHHVDYKKLWHDVEFTAKFDNPPTTLFHGDFENLKATVSGVGFVNTSFNQNTGINFQYSSEGINLEENSQISVDLSFKEESTNPWFAVPEPREGAEISIEASVWPCSIENVLYCNVKWVYKAEMEAVDEPTTDEIIAKPPECKKLTDSQKNDLEDFAQVNIDDISGNVEIFREGDWYPGEEGDILLPGDAIRTGANGHVKLIINKIEIEVLGISQVRIRTPVEDIFTTVNIGKNSEICVGTFFEMDELKPGFLEILKGAVRMFTEGWKKGTGFDATVGTTTIGIRGSEVIVTYDTDPEKVGAYVLEGHMDVTTETGETKSLTNIEKLFIENGIIGEIQPLSQEEWDTVVKERVLGDVSAQGYELVFESRSKPKGSSILIPLTLKGSGQGIGNMDLNLKFDSSVIEATNAVKGSLSSAAIFDFNILSKDTVKIALAHKSGFGGGGSVAYVEFDVVGETGETSPLEITGLSANYAHDLSSMSIPTKNGLFTVSGATDNKGDCNGDGKLTAIDALCALQMSVGKRPSDQFLDVNGDESVTSLDARRILRAAAGLEVI